MDFYKALREVIKKEVIPHHDGIIEGGIGNNFARYDYFRGMGYEKWYIGINLEKPNLLVREGLIYREGNCFDVKLLTSILDEYQLKSSIFITNAALADCLLLDGVNIENVVEALTKVFKEQLHLKPAGKFPITISRVNFPEQTDNKEYHKFMRFLEESRKRGWKEKVWRNIILLKKEV